MVQAAIAHRNTKKIETSNSREIPPATRVSKRARIGTRPNNDWTSDMWTKNESPSEPAFGFYGRKKIASNCWSPLAHSAVLFVEFSPLHTAICGKCRVENSWKIGTDRNGACVLCLEHVLDRAAETEPTRGFSELEAKEGAKGLRVAVLIRSWKKVNAGLNYQ